MKRKEIKPILIKTRHGITLRTKVISYKKGDIINIFNKMYIINRTYNSKGGVKTYVCIEL